MRWFYHKGSSGFSSASTAEDVTAGVDGQGLVAVITGASSGIGLETARVLALRGVHVVMAVRNVSAGLDAREAIVAKIPVARIDVLELDLSSVASVRRFASNFDSLNLPLNILINNAGVMTRSCTRSYDGLELHFATNHIGHFLLTNLLLENMKKTCRDSGIEGRIVNLTSSAHSITYREGICFDKIHDPSSLNDFVAYGQSKLANILHSNELSRILKEDGVNISANAVHPGVIMTNLFRNRTIVSGISSSLAISFIYHMSSRIGKALLNSIGRIICRTVEQGAATTCYVAMHPQVRGISGKYFTNCDVANPSSQASDAELAKKLWQFSLQIVSS
ncbi:Short-chain dehydrogenase TIC 32, chloroplastic [Zea mays]|uniref:Short-chain dehydrogenase TIC 32, chloroplastic n=1 Tax=Zea mays TaxID=4577 RepID=A0A317Y902_MAIZE|nr:Short-chain dehydrogenase TIC 32, chloroplastic [Zea mays]